MKNLCGEKLKESIKRNLEEAFGTRRRGEATDILFKFIVNPKTTFKEKIQIFGGVYFRDVYFKVINPELLDLITDNFPYDSFAFIQKEFKPGEVECHGHGDFWATDKFIFTYYRLPEEEENEKSNKDL